MKVAVLTIHGIGNQKPNFADQFHSNLNKLFLKYNSLNEVQYYPFEWQHLIEPKEESFIPKLTKLHWRLTRDFAFTYIGDVIAYSRQLDWGFYQAVHKELNDKIIEINQWLGEDGKLIIVGHSLGTVIMFNFIYDLQNSDSRGNFKFQALSRPYDILDKISSLYTLGSPLALFSLSHENGGKPISVLKWTNIYSPYDVIGYPLKTINNLYSSAQYITDIPNCVGGILTKFTPISHIFYLDSKTIQRLIVEDIL